MSRIVLTVDGAIAYDSGAAIVSPSPTPDAIPAPTPTAPAIIANRTLVLKNKSDGIGIPGFSYNTNGAVYQHQPANEIWAWKFAVNDLLGIGNSMNGLGSVQLYSLVGGSPTLSITTSPGQFAPTNINPPSICQKFGLVNLKYAENDYPASDADLASHGYCRLPPLPPGQDFYHVNLIGCDPANPAVSTIEGPEFSYFLEYQPG